jgi:peroxiredoxin
MIGAKNTTLLSDFWPHGQVASQYGAFRDQDGIAERANVVLDENHNIIFYKIYSLDEQPDMEEVYKLL